MPWCDQIVHPIRRMSTRIDWFPKQVAPRSLDRGPCAFLLGTNFQRSRRQAAADTGLEGGFGRGGPQTPNKFEVFGRGEREGFAPPPPLLPNLKKTKIKMKKIKKINSKIIKKKKQELETTKNPQKKRTNEKFDKTRNVRAQTQKKWGGWGLCPKFGGPSSEPENNLRGSEGWGRERWGPPKGGAPERVGPPKGGGPKRGGPNCRAFFPSPATIFRFFSLSLGVLHVEFWWCLKRQDTQMCTFGVLWPRRAHFRAPALQTPPKFHEKTPQRERRKKIVAGEGKKNEILGGGRVRRRGVQRRGGVPEQGVSGGGFFFFSKKKTSKNTYTLCRNQKKSKKMKK